MAAKAFDILLNRFETVPNFNIRDNKGRTLYDYIMDTPYRGCAIEFLKKIENALQREETPYFPSIEPEIEHLRSIGHRFAMRVEDVLNIVCGESTTFFNVLSDPSK